MIPRRPNITRNKDGYFVTEHRSNSHEIKREVGVEPSRVLSADGKTTMTDKMDDMLKSLDQFLETTYLDTASVSSEPMEQKKQVTQSSSAPTYNPLDSLLEELSSPTSENVFQFTSPKNELELLEQSETNKVRLERERLKREQRAADKREAEMVAAERVRRIAEDKSKRDVKPFVLFIGDRIQEQILVPGYVEALRTTLNADRTLTPVPEDFKTPDGYDNWRHTVNMSIQDIVSQLLKFRFLDPEGKRNTSNNSVKITLKVVEANGLIAKEGRSRDPYCAIDFGSVEELDNRKKEKSRELYMTQIIHNTTHPRWNEHLHFDAKNLTDRVQLEVWDHNKDQCLGRARIMFGEIISKCARNGYLSTWLKLEPREGKKDKYCGGEILIEASMEKDQPRQSKISTSEQLHSQLVSSRINFNSLFTRLFKACLVLDSHAGKQLISQESTQMLRLWAKEWGVSQAYQVLIYLKLIFEMSADDYYPIDTVVRAFNTLYANIKKDGWLGQSETDFSIALLDVMREYYSGNVVKYKEYFQKNKPDGALEDTILLLRMIHRFPAYKRAHPELNDSFREELRNMLTEACISRFQRYRELTAPFDETNVESVVEGINKLAEMVTEEIESDHKYFQPAFAKELDIVRLTAEMHLKYFVMVLEDSTAVLSAEETVLTASKIVFALYTRIKHMDDRYTKWVPHLKASRGFSAERWFSPFMTCWLTKLADKTSEWVINAVKADSFEPLQMETEDGIPSHSSSITDIFSAIYANLELITDLKWSDVLQNAEFFQAFAKTINQAMEKYSDALCDQNIASESLTTVTVTQFAQSFLGSDSALPQDIDLVQCVKLRNIEYAMSKLKDMYKIMNVAAITQTVRSHRSPPPRTDLLSGVMRIQVIFAENLKPVNRNGLANPFVVIRVPEGTMSGADAEKSTLMTGSTCELLKSRAISDSINPNWNETFEVILPPVSRIEVAVFSRNIITADELIGAAILDVALGTRLRRRISDHQTHDIFVELDPQGRLLLRLALDGEGEDLDFWFRKTHERLLRTRDDLLRSITLKIIPYAKDVITKSIKDQEATAAARTFFSSLTTAVQYGDATAAGASIHEKLSESEADEALGPLLDYLNRNLEILCVSISPEMTHEVVKRIWEECLLVLKSLLIPTLYGQIDRDRRVLNIRQLSVVDWCIRILREFFHAGGEGLGLPLNVLDSPQYFDLILLETHYLDPLDRLRREYEASLLGGREKEYLLCLVRLRYEKDEASDKTEFTTWFEAQLNRRRTK